MDVDVDVYIVVVAASCGLSVGCVTQVTNNISISRNLCSCRALFVVTSQACRTPATVEAPC